MPTSSRDHHSLPQPARQSLWAIAALLLILILALSLRIMFFKGLLFDDSVEVAVAAQSLNEQIYLSSEGTSELLATVKSFYRSIRIIEPKDQLITLTTIISYHYFGPTEFTSILVPLTLSLGITILIFFLGKELFGVHTGLIGSFLWGVLPLSIFLSIDLVRIIPNVFMNTVIVYFFVLYIQKSQMLFLFGSLSVLAIGMYMDWTIFLSTLLFLIIYFFSRSDVNYMRKITGLAYFIGAGLLIFTLAFIEAIDLYYLTMLIFDNYLLIPLILICLVMAANKTSIGPLNLLLAWLGAKALGLLIASHWIVQNPEISYLGMASYWLDLLVPAVLLIGWSFSLKFRSLEVSRFIVIVSTFLLIGIVGVFRLGANFPSGPLTISRISVGLAFLLIPCVLLFSWATNWGASHKIMPAYLLLFAVASFSITNTYVEGHANRLNLADDVLVFFNTLQGECHIVTGEQDLYKRLWARNGFNHMRELDSGTLTFGAADLTGLPNRTSGCYYLGSTQYTNYVLGLIPDTWVLLKEFSVPYSDTIQLYKIEDY